MATRKRSRPKRSAAPKRGARKPARRPSRTPAARRRASPATKSRRAPARGPRAAGARAAATPPSAIGMQMQHMDYTSQAMDEIKRFYTELLGFSQYREMTGAMRYLAVTTGPSSSLGFMPPMEGGPDQWSPPREPTLYFMVQDVDAAYRTLSNRGVSFDEPPRDMPWGHRVARLKDPEGRRVCLAQQKMK